MQGVIQMIRNIFLNQFAARGRHGWLWPKTTVSLKSHAPLFEAGGRHNCFWPKATWFLKSQRCFVVFEWP